MENQIEEMIRLAALAPSGHNTQPWKFVAADGAIRILPDFSRRLPVVDPDDHALYISLGCALENLVIAAGHFGYWSEADCPAPDGRTEIRVRLRPSSRATGAGGLFAALGKRQTNRRRYDGKPLPAGHLRSLVETARGAGVYALPFTGAEAVSRLIPYVEEGNRAQFTDPAFVSELLRWVRFSRAEAARTGDGLTAAVMGLPWAPRRLGEFLLRTFARPASEARRQAALLRSSGAALLFVAEENRPGYWIELGRAFERVALLATTLGIQHAHVNMPCEVERVRAELGAGLGLGTGHPLLLVRLGYAPPAARSPRRPPAAVFSRRA